VQSKHVSSPSPKKFICRMGYGVVLVDFVPLGQTLCLWDIMWMQTLCYCLINYHQQFSKSDEFFCRKASYLHSTWQWFSPHSTCQTVEKIEEMGWELLPHPQCSPDLAPSDFHLFESLKESLGGIKFENYEDVRSTCPEVLQDDNRWLAELRPSFQKCRHSLVLSVQLFVAW